MANWAIIAGAGKSRRMKVKSKLLLPLLGKAILVWTLTPFEKSKLIDGIILVSPPDLLSSFQELIKKSGFKKVKKIIPGGDKRQDSVYRAFKLLPPEVQYVAVHDGARPLLSVYLLEKVLQAGIRHQAAIPAVPVYDSLKLVKTGAIQENIPREGIWAAQTPQVFSREILAQAFQQAGKDKFYGSDEASLVSRLPFKVRIVLGSPENLKVTTPQELAALTSLAKKENSKP